MEGPAALDTLAKVTTFLEKDLFELKQYKMIFTQLVLCFEKFSFILNKISRFTITVINTLELDVSMTQLVFNPCKNVILWQDQE